MLRSCKYCGRVHDTKHDCGRKPARTKIVTHKDRFRRTQAWRDKSIHIRERDRYLCQVCIRKLHGYERQYNYDSLQVHHIYSLEEDFEKRLDDENLITLCSFHHELAENNQISKQELLRMAREQEKHPPPTMKHDF